MELTLNNLIFKLSFFLFLLIKKLTAFINWIISFLYISQSNIYLYIKILKMNNKTNEKDNF